jgi:hypothetical protein
MGQYAILDTWFLSGCHKVVSNLFFRRVEPRDGVSHAKLKRVRINLMKFDSRFLEGFTHPSRVCLEVGQCFICVGVLLQLGLGNRRKKATTVGPFTAMIDGVSAAKRRESWEDRTQTEAAANIKTNRFMSSSLRQRRSGSYIPSLTVVIRPFRSKPPAQAFELQLECFNSHPKTPEMPVST